MKTISVVIPVKDGARYLVEVLEALDREPVQEILVIDSGSRDESVAIARAAGARVLEIPPSEFGHGRTRNLGAERTRGELIAFLTQDATPCPGWADAYREAFGLAPNVGAAYGPHLPRPGTSPMISRELEEFFAGFASGEAPAIQRAGDPAFLSNVNACYARACWAAIRFREVRYSEDQAFGADLLGAGWAKVYHPGAAVHHAHDYTLGEFMRRYFDEYRGLRETTGHVEPFSVGGTLRHVFASVGADLEWMREREMARSERLRWAARSAAHHGGRKAFAALGSRADRLPSVLERRLSLEGPGSQSPVELAAGTVEPAPPRPGIAISPRDAAEQYAVAAEVMARGPAPLRPAPAGISRRARLHIAMIVPRFDRGSGGHNTLFQIFSRLERRGHVGSVWLHDYEGRLAGRGPATLRHDINEYFAPIRGPVYKGFAQWHGADVVIATGWQTVHPALRLEDCRARVYLVNDHEPDFYAVSAEQALARDTYGYGLHCIAASPWLRDLLIDRYGASADVFQLGVDHAVYQPRPLPRRQDTVVYYARHSTPRRAVPIGLMALAELRRRRPDIRIVLFGSPDPVPTSFEYEHRGVLTPTELSWLYSEATVGLCLSMTNFSLMPKEMLACGLPCVELEGVSAESIFGADGPIELAPLQPSRIADALERLLDDPGLRAARSRAGRAFVAGHTWDHATDEVEAGLRHALALRESTSTASLTA